MKFEDLSKKYANFYSPSYQILVDGRDLKSLAEVISVTFEDTLDGADRFSFTLGSIHNNLLEFLELGKEVEIKMGYLDKLTPMIVGEITSIELNFSSNGDRLEISGYDLSYQFTQVRKHRSFENMRDSDVVERIASEARHRLRTEIEPTEVVHPYIVQNGETDYRFISMLAERNNFEFFVRERTLYFRRPRKEGDMIALEYGKTLLSFRAEINMANQVSEVIVKAWNPKTKQEIVGRARREGSGRVEQITDKPVFSQQEADKLARSILDKLSEGLVRGNAECIGIPEMRAGTIVELKGLGRFDGKYYVERTSHTISSSGYTTTFNVRGIV
ncbi:hypothetical protein DRP04_09160 [Archaeoglobales archaeon]|nr:MAG: hypothetical protein DRP04_09160 [Archaeoglobales archaeon]